ncbi:DedA family protein [Burkholderiaceae bacterium DAT-1]|nr:DedA family protein [Burkholderiaceae bacterium DAT-1]
MNLIDIILHLDVFLKQMVQAYGGWIYLILFLVIFCETGLVVMPFLPGDSLLFVAGAIAATGGMNPFIIALVLFVAAVLGDSTNYLIGRYLGEKLFSKPNSKLFRKDYLERTHAFYERHGGKTVTLARFLPIIRTFAPFVAGVGHMNYLRFLTFSVLGSILWIGGLVTLGYQFGNVPFVQRNLSVMIVAVIALSFVPMVLQLVRQRFVRS